MVLPLPVAPGTQMIEFVSLQGFDDFFASLRSAFANVADTFATESYSPAVRRLPVEKVGAFEASFVPSLADFARLDERFRLSKSMQAALARYPGFGFAVFQLGVGDQKVHPMAFRFHTAEPHRLYFPTRHLHGSVSWPLAHFDHKLFCQNSVIPPGWKVGGVRRHEAVGMSIKFWMQPAPMGELMPIHRTQGLLDAQALCYSRDLSGYRWNRDLWLPAG